MVSTEAYLENLMTGFHQYALVGLTQNLPKLHKAMYAEMNAVCGSAGNEATAHYVLVKLRT